MGDTGILKIYFTILRAVSVARICENLEINLNQSVYRIHQNYVVGKLTETADAWIEYPLVQSADSSFIHRDDAIDITVHNPFVFVLRLLPLLDWRMIFKSTCLLLPIFNIQRLWYLCF